MKIKPLLATKVELDKLAYPVLATPKLDGIRCLMVDGVAMSRSMKPIPNNHVQKMLADYHGLDGELMVKGDFNSVQSAIMSQDGEPDFTYWVFDSFLEEDLHLPYEDRVEELHWAHDPGLIEPLLPLELNDEEELLVYLEYCLSEGYEGVMVRSPEGKYKFGRSTVKEGILLKLKRFFDDEGVLIEVTEKMHNANELEQDELGYAKRSSKKENLVPAGTAGSCVIEWNGIQFRVGFGPGIDDANKKQIWDMRTELQGQLVKFSYQELSKDGVPRFGKMLSIRHPDDL